MTSSGETAHAKPEAGHYAFSIQLFGPLAVRCHGQLIPKMRSRKEQWLLAILVLRAHTTPIDRVWLAATLWPDSDESTALYYLRRSLMLLRDALGAEAVRIVSPTPRTLRFDLANADCDTFAFDEALRRAQSGDSESFKQAVDLYSGVLLEGCTEDWVFHEREVREQGVLSVLAQLAQRAKARGDSAACVALFRRTMDINPLQETALRGLMEALAAESNHAAAGEAYRAFRVRLRRELNADPAPETVRLNRQIHADGRKSMVAPARSTDESTTETIHSHLPTALSTLIGRHSEREVVLGLLETSRLVTLTGAGGVGKTRLSLAVSASVQADFPDGVYFVDLAPITDAGLLTATVLAALEIRERGERALPVVLEEHLQAKRLLIVLDNCEHILADCARLAQSLLQSCAHLRLIATSREPLRIGAEVVWLVPQLVAEEAMQLFVERARQVNFSFQRTEANASAIERICARLEGIPLAIEMAAARTRGMSVLQIAKDLDDVFRLLNRPSGNLDPRHQTLRATLNWSYELLTEPERVLLANLSVFAGGWTIEAMESVCADATSAPEMVTDRLLDLVDKSLVVFTENADGEGRYRLLETTRSFAAEHLSADARESLHHPHLRYFSGIAELARTKWEGPEEPLYLARLEAELPNIRAALHWSLTTNYAEKTAPGLIPEEERPLRLGLLLASALLRFWLNRGLFAEGRQFLERALLRDDVKPRTEAHARALNACGAIANRQRDFESARDSYLQAVAIREALGDSRGMAVSLRNVSETYVYLDDMPNAIQSLSSAVALCRESGDQRRAERYQQSLDALLAQRGDDRERSYQIISQLLATAERDGDIVGISQYLGQVALEAIRLGRAEEARMAFCRALKIEMSIRNQSHVAEIFEGLAALIQPEQEDRLARLYGAAQALRRTIQSPMLEANATGYRQNCAQARSIIGDPAFDAAFEQGYAMSFEVAIEYALAEGKTD